MKVLFLAGASAVSLAAFSANEAAAQASDNPIAHCRDTTATDKERIACLEAAITGMMSSRQPVAAAEVRETPQAGSDEEEDEAEDARLAAAEAEAEPAPAGLGAEQVLARQEREGVRGADASNDEGIVVNAILTEHAKTNLGKIVFFLDNGQIWRQRDSDRNRIRLPSSKKYTVTISEGAISGYRLKINELNRTIVAERLK